LWKIKAWNSKAQTGIELREMSTNVDNNIWWKQGVSADFCVYNKRIKRRELGSKNGKTLPQENFITVALL
jgi:hypothetical protein